MELAFEFTYEIDVNWKIYVENGLEGYHVAVVHDVLNDFVETKSARQHFEEHSSYTHAFIKPEYQAMIPELPHLSAEEQRYVRFGHVFPNLIPVIAPAEFSYLRIDPIGPERIRLVARSFDLGGELAGLRDFRKRRDRPYQPAGHRRRDTGAARPPRPRLPGRRILGLPRKPDRPLRAHGQPRAHGRMALARAPGPFHARRDDGRAPAAGRGRRVGLSGRRLAGWFVASAAW
jgi:hypothetical protein